MTERLPGPVVCVTGPTASGKSDVADLVAARLGVPVVSVDAMQVYRGMDVGTAKVPEHQRRVPLQMVDVVDPDDPYSVALFQHDARACVDATLSRGLPAVLCGGTGLYLDAVIDEMDFPAGTLDDSARRAYEAIAAERGGEALWELLRSRDPESARLVHPHNTRRVVRALELADQGASYARRTEMLTRRPAHYDAVIWALVRDRSELYDRIDRRVDRMFSEGLEDEVRGLLDRGLGDSVTALQAIGYKEVAQALAGECTMAEARERVKRSTRRYAKRQLSWIRRDGRARTIDMDAMGPQGACDLILEDLSHRMRDGS